MAANDIAQSLRKDFGISVNIAHLSEWMKSIPSNMPIHEKKEKIAVRLLAEDLHKVSGDTILPQNIENMENQTLGGLFFLQVDDLINAQAPPNQLDQKMVDNGHRILKLRLTDGKRTVYGMELHRIEGISISSPPGLKIIVKDPVVRLGLLLLHSGNTKILGGRAESLVAARARRLEEDAKKLEKQKYYKTGEEEEEGEDALRIGDAIDQPSSNVVGQIVVNLPDDGMDWQQAIAIADSY